MSSRRKEKPQQLELDSNGQPFIPASIPIGNIRAPQWRCTAVTCKDCKGDLWTNELDPNKIGPFLACINCGKCTSTGLLEEQQRRRQFAIARKAQRLREQKQESIQ